MDLPRVSCDVRFRLHDGRARRSGGRGPSRRRRPKPKLARKAVVAMMDTERQAAQRRRQLEPRPTRTGTPLVSVAQIFHAQRSFSLKQEVRRAFREVDQDGIETGGEEALIRPPTVMTGRQA